MTETITLPREVAKRILRNIEIGNALSAGIEMRREIEAALEQPQGEHGPLFWYRPRSDGLYEGPLHKSQIERVRKESGGWVPLYTHPQPKREPLTVGQINRLIADGKLPLSGNPYEVARAIERAHGIGGEA